MRKSYCDNGTNDMNKPSSRLLLLLLLLLLLAVVRGIAITITTIMHALSV